jgi:GH24 family phage-related lysozyme (muramidase)
MCWSVKKWEAYKKKPYYCQAGRRTVGWGFTDVKSVKDVHDADRIFKAKIEECYSRINKRFPRFTYMQKSVLVSLLYNTGDMKGIENSGFVKYLERGEKSRAVKRLLMWNKVRHPDTGKLFVSKGLVNRRAFEAKLIEGTFGIEDYNALKKEVTYKYTAK